MSRKYILQILNKGDKHFGVVGGNHLGFMGPFDTLGDAADLVDAHSDRLTFNLAVLLTDEEFVELYNGST